LIIPKTLVQILFQQLKKTNFAQNHLQMKNLKIFTLLAFMLMYLGTNAQTTVIIESLPANTPANASVYMAGNFNNWNPGDVNFKLTKNQQEKFELKHSWNAGTTLSFKFTMGSWNTVEKGTGGEEISDRQYTVKQNDTLKISIANWASTQNGSATSTAAENVFVLTDSFYMPQLDRYRRIILYLPPNYNESTESYPVIYMHDGQNLFDAATSFAGEWKVDETLNNQAEQGYKKVIVVGIDNGGSERINELTPYSNAQYGGGDGHKYLQFITDTLKPYIDEHYRTKSDRENTAIWGSSLGGLISFYAAMQMNDIFGLAGVFSPSLWFSDSIYTLAAMHSKNYATKMYFLAGGKEGDGSLPAECNQMLAILKANNYEENELLLKTVASGEHNEAFWSAEFGEAFLWLFENISSVEKEKLISTFKVFPTPAFDTITIESANNEAFTIKLYNNQGKLILKQKGIQKYIIERKNWPAGIYHIILNQNKKQEKMKVILK